MGYTTAFSTGNVQSNAINNSTKYSGTCDREKHITTCNPNNKGGYNCFTECVPLTKQQENEYLIYNSMIVGWVLLGLAVVVIAIVLYEKYYSN